MAYQGGYGANHMVVIEEASANLAHETSEDRAVVKNVTNKNSKLTTHVEEYVNHLTAKYAKIMVLTKKTTNIQGEPKNLNSKS